MSMWVCPTHGYTGPRACCTEAARAEINLDDYAAGPDRRGNLMYIADELIDEVLNTTAGDPCIATNSVRETPTPVLICVLNEVAARMILNGLGMVVGGDAVEAAFRIQMRRSGLSV